MGATTGVEAGVGTAGVDAGSGLDAATGVDAAGAGVVGSRSGDDAAAGELVGMATGMTGLATAAGVELEPPPQAARQMLSPATAAALQQYPGR